MVKAIHAPKSIWQKPLHFMAFGFGSGAIPYAPGTFGTLATIPLYFWLRSYPLWIYLLITIFVAVFGVWLCGKVSRETRTHDHQGMVWDEISGYLIVMIALPHQPFYWIAGFLLFRLFDIWKPWPISWADKNVKGGLGMMLDDWLAALPAWIVLQLISFFH